MPLKVLLSTPEENEDMPDDMEERPSILQVYRKTRRETMAMFYHTSSFYVDIDRFNFSPLIEWIESTTSGPKPPRLKVNVTMRHKMICFADLERLATEWRPLNHETVHLQIRSSYRSVWVNSMARFYSRDKQIAAVKLAISVAQMAKAAGEGDAYVLQQLRSEAIEQQWTCGERCRSDGSGKIIAKGYCSVKARKDYGVRKDSMVSQRQG